MQVPGFAAKLLATERRLAGIAKAASSRAISAAGAKTKAAAATLAAARLKSLDTKRLPLIVAAALAFFLVLLFIALAIAAGPRKVETLPAEASSPSREYFEALIMPAPLPGELPFPLARERKSRYTEAEVQNLRPDLGELYLGDSVERRKAELEAIYNAVD